ncbi:acetolactate synthase-1/2/3 large subunit [Palleronia marisminoris]|uniref:thiamine pyrophosphate-requiring protein n=1 Tax=Palleronia marisminoris TaxID=315423 RepID=UPI0008E000AD|nr:thiamine pyrophosphate-requiring protein [Palleronia marisminoris]SFH27332.1 acetolactate synthase-1/2/3 large subunit [Palleronia marisminoris]
MADISQQRITAGGAIFPRLHALGVDYVFANSGTDFPPIIEGLAEAAVRGEKLPEAVVIPHEHAAMGMAHGYYLITGRAQAVMLHTNVGLANGAIGAINAACEQVPILLMSGRTPVMEGGRFGGRTVPIGWGQEMRDQTAMVRESCKWDYELKFPEQIAPMLDRGHAIAHSSPAGPIYMSLPREILCETIAAEQISGTALMAPSRAAPDPAAIAQAAKMLAGADNPLVIAQRGMGDAETFVAFATWAEEWGIPVSSYWANRLCIPTDHPCHIGIDHGPFMEKADVVVVLDCLAPWWPDKHSLNPSAKVINIGADPLHNRFPARTFRSDLTIAGDTVLMVPALIEAMGRLDRPQGLEKRRKNVAEAADKVRAKVVEIAEAHETKGITKQYLGRTLSRALENRTSSVFNELGTMLGPLERREHASWFDAPHSGGLGWGLPAAMGAKLADRSRTVVATIGDGSYMFANPTVCHQIAEAMEIPLLIIISNNEEWGAVRASVVNTYPDGHAVKANQMPLTALKPTPEYIKTAEASRAWARRVEAPHELAGAIEEGLAQTEKGRVALLDVATLPG